MKYYATALKSFFPDLIKFDINNNLVHDHQLKQDMLENVWAAICELDRDPAHRYEIDGILDSLNDAIVFLEEMKTTRRKAEFVSNIKETIENLQREIR